MGSIQGRVAVASVLVAVAACAAGCGSPTSASQPTGGRSAAADTARLKFAQCMRDHGIDVPDSPGRGGGFRQALRSIDRSKLQTAMQACRKYRDQAFGNITPQQRQEFRDAFVKFAACMRQHGVEIPDPGAGPGPGGAPGGRRFLIDRNDPKVQAAMQACRSNLPNGGRFGGGPRVVGGAR